MKNKTLLAGRTFGDVRKTSTAHCNQGGFVFQPETDENMVTPITDHVEVSGGALLLSGCLVAVSNEELLLHQLLVAGVDDI